jgi:hypothetical protein
MNERAQLDGGSLWYRLAPIPICVLIVIAAHTSIMTAVSVGLVGVLLVCLRYAATAAPMSFFG